MNLQDDRLRILIVEDEELDQLLMQRVLDKSDLIQQSRCVDDRAGFLAQLDSFTPDIILCDYAIPRFGALDALGILHNQGLQIPLIIVTGALTDELAVECLKKGAIDYVLKDKIVRLPSAIKLAIQLVNSQREKSAAEKRLRASEQQLKIITDVLPASLTYISKDFRFEFSNKINDEWFERKINGAKVDEVLGKDVFEKIQEIMPELLKGGQARFESELTRKKAPRFINIIFVPDFENTIEMKGFVCLITDITDRKIYENKLKAAKQAADNANSAKTQFLANMSHEIRTPLNVIMGLSELLITDPDAEPGERTLWLKKIVRNSEHLRKVIDEILDVSKIEAGKIQVNVIRFSVNELIGQLKSFLWPLALEKQLEIDFNIIGTIPEFIHSDPVKLRHILMNVLDNAIKFSSQGPIVLQARIENEDTEPKIVFIIKDIGIGMSKKHAVQLFEPFTQVDSSMTRRFGGTGLGLALARQLARTLGGDVHLAESSPGKGSTFVVSIATGPIADSPRIAAFSLIAEHENALPEPASLRADISGMRVLVVEDSLDNQLFIKSFLKKAGVRVEVASDGKEGVQKALADDYDIVLMDIQMPVMDGYTATSRLRKSGYAKPILAFTAHALQDEKASYTKAGFNGFISKPVRKNELLNCLAQYNNH